MAIPRIHPHAERHIHYMTLTVVDWLDIFTKPPYFEAVIETLKHYQKSDIYVISYVIMTNHMHMMCQAKHGKKLSDFVRGFKSYTTKIIWELLQYESRNYIKDQLLKNADLNTKKKFRIWQKGNYPLEIYSTKFIQSKMKYIHENPVKKGYVLKPEDWAYSSARNYFVRNDDLVMKVELLWE
jgi:REP element-mobilizing transposase RayT